MPTRLKKKINPIIPIIPTNAQNDVFRVRSSCLPLRLLVTLRMVSWSLFAWFIRFCVWFDALKICATKHSGVPEFIRVSQESDPF